MDIELLEQLPKEYQDVLIELAYYKTFMEWLYENTMQEN
jgi:hypothetical protein